jgi:integrase
LDELWDSYVKYQASRVSPNTLKDFRKFKNHIDGLPTKSLEDAIEIRAYLISNKTLDTTKRLLKWFSSACIWGIDSELINSNPFWGRAGKIETKNKGEKFDINPYSAEERDLIIEEFKKDKLYNYYAPFVEFLFFTGCRPNEATALQWKHINNTHIRFEQNLISCP